MSDPADDTGFDPTDRLADLLYTGVGLGVIAINRLQVARRDLEKSLGGPDGVDLDLGALQELLSDPERLRRLAGRVQSELRDMDDRLDGIERRVSSLLGDLEPDLPPALREVSRLVRQMAGEHADQVRALLGLEER